MDNLISLFFYLSLFALSASLIFLGQKYRRKSLTFIGLLLPILIATLRFNTGIDYPNYVEISKNLANLSKYAKEMKLYTKVMNVMEVLLNG